MKKTLVFIYILIVMVLALLIVLLINGKKEYPTPVAPTAEPTAAQAPTPTATATTEPVITPTPAPIQQPETTPSAAPTKEPVVVTPRPTIESATEEEIQEILQEAAALEDDQEPPAEIEIVLDEGEGFGGL